MEFLSVTKSIPRVDALEKATGKVVFCTDFKLSGMLHAKLLRSPHPHARIVSINTSKAERLPGVKCIVTGKDAPEKRYGMLLFDQPVLAKHTVRYVGEPVAAVAADDLDIAEEALELIEVEYKELPAIFDAEEAMSTNPQTVVHRDLFNYDRARAWQFDLDRPNVFFHHKIRRGDVAKGFQEATLVMENEFTTERIQHCALEPHATIVEPTAGGGLTIWTGRQDVWFLINRIGWLFGISPSQVRIIRPYVGGAFGSKFPIVVEPIAVLLALKISKPIKLVLTREEVFLSGGNRVPMIIYIKDGVSKDGRLVAREMKVILKAGAYSSVVSILVRNCSFGAVGTYSVPNFSLDSYGVYVNEPPACNFRGFGSTQVAFAIESHMDMLADKLGIDNVEFRRKNILREGDPNVTGEITHSIGAGKCLHEVAKLIKLTDQSQNEGCWKKGKGIGLGNKYCTAPTTSLARVKIAEDGVIIVYHSADEIGQGCNTVAAQIAAEEFGIPIDRVKVIFADTLVTPFFNGGATSSRITYHLGNAVKAACLAAKKRLFEVAAERLHADPGELETKGGEVYFRGIREKSIKISEVFSGYKGDYPGGYGAYTTGGEIIGEGAWVQEYIPEDPETGQIDPGAASEGIRLVSFWSHAAKAVEVAVDVETGQVRVLQVSSAADMGLPINPKMCEQQMDGGVGMGIGDSLYEEMIVERGVVKNPNFTDYRVPSVTQMPFIDNVKLVFAPAPHKDGPFGAKGLGEVALIGMQPAIANAIYDAVGVRIKSLPITAERLLQALKEKNDRGNWCNNE